MEENDLLLNLKSLEGNNYNSETALFDALNNVGVSLPKGYKSGGRNKKLAQKEADRYVEYKHRCEIDPAYKNTRAVTITNIRDPPKPKEDQRGTRGRYADYLKPLITFTAMDGQFQGTRAELFDLWGVYDPYREEQIKAGLFKPKKGYTFSPWQIAKTTPPGAAKYYQVIKFIERNSLESALDFLSKKSIIEWKPCIMYVPIIKTTDFVDSVDRLKSWKEYIDDCDKRLDMVTHLAEQENCVLSPDLFQKGLYVSRELYDWWNQVYYISNGKELPNECATEVQVQMYDNYKSYIQQLTVSEIAGSEGLCPVENIPERYKFFTDFNYRRKFNDLDKIWKPQLLGWEQVRKELFFKLIDEERSLKYFECYSSEMAFELGCEYILYMDEHIEKERVYYPKNFTSDYEGNGILSAEGSSKLFPLSTSRSAVQLHQKLKELFHL